MELGDSGTASGPLNLFCARLKRLQMASGISQSRLADTAHLGKSQMSDILNGKIKRLPDWDVAITVVRACLEYAETKDRPVPLGLRDEGDWRRRYADLEHDFDAGARPRLRNEALPGRSLAEVTDPFTVEVHRPLQPDAPQVGLPALPAYVAREHDAELERVVVAAAKGESGIAVLVGGSSTGKTRACWEALGPLRERPESWRLWHPIDPSRPEAALRELPSIGLRTIIWLNEAQFYLGTSGGLGERVAAGLRELLRDPHRAPVLVLATLWPEYWDQLTARRSAGADDPHAQARELLAGRDIAVPASFTAAQLERLSGVEDPRLNAAVAAAEDGRIVQFLAGAPELIARYRNAPPAAGALINAAMDARRLGMGIRLPLAFLECAVPGYLDDDDWDSLPEDWLEQSLAYTAAPTKGTHGLLTRIRPRSIDSDPGPAYRLADYLDQHGRQARRPHVPPASFWAAATRFAGPADLPALAKAAENCGLLRDAARFRKLAVALGNTSQAMGLLRLCHSQHSHSVDSRPAQWAAAHASLDQPVAVAWLLDALRKAGAGEQVAMLLARDPAANARLDDPYAVARLLEALQRAGAGEQVAMLLARDPAANANLDDPGAVARLLETLLTLDAGEQVAVLLACDPAANARLDNPYAVARLLEALRRAGVGEQVAMLLARDPAANARLDIPGGVAWLLDALRKAGAGEQVAVLLARDPAANARLDIPGGVAWLLNALRRAGAGEQVAMLLARDPAANANLDNPRAVRELLDALGRAGAEEQVRTLADRLPASEYLDAFGRQAKDQTAYRFGREPDGSPAPSWGWNDLD